MFEKLFKLIKLIKDLFKNIKEDDKEAETIYIDENTFHVPGWENLKIDITPPRRSSITFFNYDYSCDYPRLLNGENYSPEFRAVKEREIRKIATITLSSPW